MPIICVYHYGKVRKLDAILGERVPAYKVGGITESQAMLIGLKDQARKVKPKRQGTYHYIWVADDADVISKRGWLAFDVAEEALSTIESATRQDPFPHVYRWDGDGWAQFPSRDHDAYKPAAECYNPPTFRPEPGVASDIADVQTTERLAGNGVVIERTEKEGGEPWWWISGETYPHRQMLKANGCRWAKKRKAWYVTGDPLPDAIHALVGESLPPEPTNPPLSEDDGLELLPGWLIDQIAARRGESAGPNPTVFAKLFTPDADWTLFVSDYDAANRRIFCYAILNGDLQMAEWGWQMPDHLAEVRGRFKLPMERDIAFKPQPLHEALAAYRHARGYDSDDTYQETASSAAIPVVTNEPPATELQLEGGLYPIPMAYVGQMNVIGDCFVFGLALDETIPVYLNIAGAATSVEAVWAKLAQGKAAHFVPDTGPGVPLQPPDKGLYARFQKKVGTLGVDHLILLHRDTLTPTYAELSKTYILYANEDQFTAKVGEHVKALVNVPVFTDWYPYLAEAARSSGLAQRCRSYGELAIYKLTLDQERWTRIVQSGLENGNIQLP